METEHLTRTSPGYSALEQKDPPFPLLNPVLDHQITAAKRPTEYTTLAKEMLRPSLPISIDNIIIAAASYGNFSFVAKLGEDVIAASSYASAIKDLSVYSLNCIFFTLQAMIAAETSKGNYKNVGYIMRNSIVLGWLISLPMILLLSQVDDILRLAGQDPHLADIAQEFFDYYLMAIPALMTMENLIQFSIATSNQNILIPMSIVRTSIELSMTYLFTERANMRVAGWGLSAGLQPYMSTAINLILIKLLKNKFSRFELFNVNINVQDLRQDARAFILVSKHMLRLGIPIAMQIAGETSIRLINSLMLGKISQKGLAAYGISTQFSYWFIMLEASIATSTCVLIAKKMAQKDINDLRRIVNVSYATGAGLILLAMPLFLSLQKEMTNIFLDNDDEAIQEFTRLMIPLSLLSVLGYGLREISAGALRGYEETKSAMIIGLLGTMFGAGLGALLAFGFDEGPVSVLIGEVAGMMVSAFALHMRYRYKSDNYFRQEAATIELISGNDGEISGPPVLPHDPYLDIDQSATNLGPTLPTPPAPQNARSPLLKTGASSLSLPFFRRLGGDSSSSSEPMHQTGYVRR